MSEMGLFNIRYDFSQKMLSSFDEALRKLHFDKTTIQAEQIIACDALLQVIEPLCDSIDSIPTKSGVFNESNIKETLQDRFLKKRNISWNNYTNAVLNIRSKLRNKDTNLSGEEIAILNDIGDALDIECSRLFHRIRGR